MGFNIKKISVLIFLIFSFNLLSEIAFSFIEDHAKTDVSSNIYQNEKSSVKDSNTSHDNCPDQSGSEQCHFGHCMHHIFTTYLTLSPSFLSTNKIISAELVPQTPFLEGPKQPPRFS
jgi:hypothetical protein